MTGGAAALKHQDNRSHAVNEDKLNMSIRKFLKQVGVTSQRELERVARDKGSGKFKVKVVLTAEGSDLNHVVEEEIDVG